MRSLALGDMRAMRSFALSEGAATDAARILREGSATLYVSRARELPLATPRPSIS